MTRIEKIRSMSAEEMAAYMCDDCMCEFCPFVDYEDIWDEPYCKLKKDERVEKLAGWFNEEIKTFDK